MDPYPTVTIDLVLDRHTARDALRGVLHAILFHRLFGALRPLTLEVLDVTLPGVADADTERLVADRVDAFWRALEGGPHRRGRITVTFAERRPKKSWFSVGEEEVPWEQWIVAAEVRQPKSERERQAADAALARALTGAVRTMLAHTSSARGRGAVPRITNAAGVSPFPVKIAVRVGGVDVAG